jgi:hypothetical protein
MKKDITRFRGCLKDVFKGRLTKSLMNYMLENKIYFKIETEYECPISDKFTQFLNYNNNVYKLNDDVLLDMYNILEADVIDSCFENDLLNDAKQKLAGKIDKKDKVQALKEIYDEIISNLNSLDDYELFVKHEEIPEHTNNNNEMCQENFCWKCQIIELITYDEHNIGIYLLNEKDIYLSLPDNEFENWSNYRKTKQALNYITEELRKLDRNNEPENKESVLINSTQKIILLEKILKYEKWHELSPNKKSLILKPLLGCHERTIRKSLNFINDKHSDTKSDIDADYEKVNTYLIKLGINLGDPTN